MKIEKIHIGQTIFDEVKNQKMTIVKFAQLIDLKKQNVKKTVFERQSLDTDLLVKISNVLNRNFFECWVFDSNTNRLQSMPKIEANLTVYFDGRVKEQNVKFNF